MGYDNVVSQSGQIGPHQWKILLVLSLTSISWAFHKMGGVFLTAKPDFRCLLPNENPGNATYRLPPNITSANYTWNYETGDWPKCERYNSDLANPHNATGENLESTPSTVKCDSFVYDETLYTKTTTTEWDLVCDNGWLNIFSNSLFMFGDLPGVLILSVLSDKYGRKSILLLGAIIQFVLGLLVATSPVFIAFIIFRFLLGMTMSGVFLIAYVIGIEMVGQKNRNIAVGVSNISYLTGYILVAGLAYFNPNWRQLQIIFCIPSFVFLVFSRYVPESVRWLLTKGRAQDAKDILQKASIANGIELSHDTLDSLLENENENEPVAVKNSIFDIFRHPNLRKKSLLLFFIWFFSGLTYYGISLNTSRLGGNDYLNFLTAAAMDAPGQVFALSTMTRFGRINILCGCLCFTGISLLLTIFVPTDMTWLLILLAMMGKLTISIVTTIMYVFTSEQYPTTVRNIGVGACSAVAKVAGTVAPYFNYLFEIATYLPLVILGSGALAAGLLSLLLPETLNQKLPETIQESVELGKIEKKNWTKHGALTDPINLSRK